MKVEARLFLFLWVFFIIVAGIYTAASFMVAPHKLEPIGLTVFLLSFLMSLMIWAYLEYGVKIDPRPEDRKGGEIVEGAGALGFFPPKSMWPFVCALVATVLVLGVVFGWWITILGAVLGVWAVCGWCYEYYVGDYQH